MSSADFWRVVYRADAAPTAPEYDVSLSTACCRATELNAVLPSWAGRMKDLEGGRVHVLVQNASVRSGAKDVVNHVWGSSLPAGSFYRCSSELYIASPEFTFLQFASQCSLVQLVAYGLELCGRYAFDPSKPRGIRQREVALTTTERLASFVRDAKGCQGQRRAQSAIRYLEAGSESPMETMTFMLERLPYRHGGYGIEGFKLNEEIPLTAEAAIIAGKQKCRADMLLESCGIDIEFDGKHDHTGLNALESDRRRANALAAMGYQVIELTSGQVRDLEVFEQIVLRIAARTGKRIEPKYRGALPARLLLRKTLFDWNAANGRAR